MGDLIAGLVLLALLSVGLFVLGAKLGRSISVRWVKVLGFMASAALLAYVAFLEDNVLLVKILPVSNLVVVGNWIPLLVSFLAGLAWSLIPRQASLATAAAQVSPPPGGVALPAKRAGRTAMQIRRFVAVIALEALGWFAVVRPLWGSPPHCANSWDGDICLQTTESSCTAACAATLLKAHGIDATEKEMADLCLTRRGTLWQGLYRGLKLKTAGSPWDVEVIHGPFEVLRTFQEDPAILAAGVPTHGQVARIYTERYGWSPGEWHSVLFFGFRDNGRVAMGDPSPGIGREEWTEEDLRVLWAGRGVRLVRRPK